MQKAILKKMHSVFNDPIEYFMDINDMEYKLNDYIGKNLRIEWQKKNNLSLWRGKKKVYRSGFCYNCYWNIPQASQSIF